MQRGKEITSKGKYGRKKNDGIELDIFRKKVGIKNFVIRVRK